MKKIPYILNIHLAPFKVEKWGGDEWYEVFLGSVRRIFCGHTIIRVDYTRVWYQDEDLLDAIIKQLK